ncbi:MAG TPA: hypothetical protein VE912_24980 [Bacteroidales bacterium]|nr:hypothetical protein [Bacteroidales bacterium]
MGKIVEFSGQGKQMIVSDDFAILHISARNRVIEMQIDDPEKAIIVYESINPDKIAIY